MSNNLLNSRLAQATKLSDEFVEVHDAYGHIAYHNLGYHCLDDRKVQCQLSPSTQVPTSLSNANIDFKLENTGCDILDFITLQWLYTNSTGSNASASCAPLHIQRLDVVSAGGNVIFSTVDQEIFQSYMFLERDSYEAIAGTIDMNATTYASNNTVVANGATIKMQLPLYGFFKPCKLALFALKNPLTVRVVFNNSSYFIASGAEMTASALTMICHGRKLAEHAKKEIYATYNNGRIPMSLSHLSVDRQQTSINLTANQTTKIQLTGIKGICSFLNFTVKLASTSNNPASNGSTTYLPMLNFDLLDGPGVSLSGGYRRDRDLQKIHWAQNFKNNAYLQTGIHHISFAEEPAMAYGMGANFGYVKFGATTDYYQNGRKLVEWSKMVESDLVQY